MELFKGKLTSRRAKEIIVPIFLTYLLLHGILFVNQKHFLYAPDATYSTPAAAGVGEMESIAVNPADMKESIEGWYKAPTDPSKPVILYFHGDGGGIAGRAPIAQNFFKQGYGFLLAEYRGYGTNAGEPSERGLYADGEAYIQWLINHEGIPESKIVLYGESLGAGVAVYLASRHLNVAGMVLDGSFARLSEVHQWSMPGIIVPLVFLDQYNSLSRIRNVTCPLLFIHGQRDKVVPLRMAQKLYDSANQPKTIKIFPEGGHADLYNYGALETVSTFLRSLK